MGVDIVFYKSSERVYKNIKSLWDTDVPINWDQLDRDHLISYFCGRHLMFDILIRLKGGTPVDKLSGADLEAIRNECQDVTTKFRIMSEEIATVPLDKLKDIVNQAEKEGLKYVTIPLEEQSKSSDWVDDIDYYQADNFLKSDFKCDEGEVIWFVNSY